MSDYYDTGTVAMSAGSTAVTGTGTSWAGLIRAGDMLEIGGRQMRIASVESSTALTLLLPAPAAASGTYAIWYTAPSRSTGLQALADMREVLAASRILLAQPGDYVVRSATTNAPPASPVTDDIYLIAAAPTGIWAGRAGHLAQWTGTGWAYTAPQAGMRALALDAGRRWARGLTAWALSPDLVAPIAVSGDIADATGTLPTARLPSYLQSGNSISNAISSNYGDYKSSTSTADLNTVPVGFRGLCNSIVGNMPTAIHNGYWFIEDQNLYGSAASPQGRRQIGTVHTTGGNPLPIMAMRTYSAASDTWTDWASLVDTVVRNANGAAYRFANGCQICTATVPLTTASASVTLSGTFVFAAAFAGLEGVSYTEIQAPPGSLYYATSHWTTSASSSSVSLRVTAPNQYTAGYELPVRATATGRWM